jgi:chromatin structure-remodeling complex subunit RSC1/2
LVAGPAIVKPFPASSTAATSTTADENEGGGVSNATATTYLVPPTRDRTFVEEVNYKGWKLKIGDWVHLSNLMAWCECNRSCFRFFCLILFLE